MLTAREGLISLMLFLTGPAVAADVDTLAADCNGCHGPQGVSAHPTIPTIAGQSPEFTSKTLRGFQFWDRPCVKKAYVSGPKAGTTTDMCKIASALSDEDIAALGLWYSEQAFVPAKQAFDPALASAGEAIHAADCEKCHANGGMTSSKAPRLAGQWMEYLAATVKFVPTGEHLCPPMMERKIAGYGKEQITQLLNYYASQQD